MVQYGTQALGATKKMCPHFSALENFSDSYFTSRKGQIYLKAHFFRSTHCFTNPKIQEIKKVWETLDQD